MDFLIRIGYLIASLGVGIYVYYWSSTFKKIGIATLEEINEDEKREEEKVTEKEAKFIRYFGTTVFILLGFYIWAILGTTIGKIAGDITNHFILKWVVYFFMYFIFLRIPFGMGSKMILKVQELESLYEKIIFSIAMIGFYIWSICCFEDIPKIFTWHLGLL